MENIQGHEDLQRLTKAQQLQLCQELRQFLIQHVSATGGHLAPNLGVVELSLAVETVFDTRVDRLVFDVGHQSYVHKILTDRRDQFSSLRRFGGIAGFPKPSESITDAFVAGHASNSVSVALGMARARTLQNQDYHVLAIIGDGATTGGLSYEGLNDAGASHEPLIIILNDNAMSISRNVGGVAHHLSRLRTRPGYFGIKRVYRTVTKKLPGGKYLYRLTHNIKNWMKNRLLDTTLFEDMGFTYIGPVDGHDVSKMIYLLEVAKSLRCPVVFHVLTKKGKGYPPAEENPSKFHGLGPFDPETGRTLAPFGLTFSDTFGDTMLNLGRVEPRLCAITAAMPQGTGLSAFSKAYPQRTFDVGIAEGHAVSMAGGLAKAGMIPVVAIYSTFLQRAYDMIIQDVAMLHLHVIFAVDRAGLVGEDGETHHGVFDVGFLRQIPGLTILCPGCRSELKEMLIWAVRKCTGPVAIRYPRGGDGAFLTAGRETLFRVGRDITIVTYGTMINQVISAADQLALRGIEAEVLRLRTIKPLDMEAVTTSVRKTGRLLVVEEAEGVGSVGHELIEKLSQRGVPVIYSGQNIGDRFVTHGAMAELYRHLNLDAEAIVRRAEEVVHREK
ncbi:MAG TPA: 1-deoxy-D-xylulose-5-phosphate synthase [Candidatus Faecousia faecigallinarum]|nr:1-deoxy-D-xylulose-5-phosphate synthase [Candidatus Faecousia faecigallinarum]